MRITARTYRPTVTAAPSAATYSLLPVTYTLNYAFSAKERDAETGLSVTSLRSVSSSSLNQTRTSSALYSLVRRFGARYYSSDLSIWLSVDPMSGKYPSLSPYVYCADNPVKCVDPNGEEFGDYYNIKGQWLGRDKNTDNVAYTATSVSKDKNGYVVSAVDKEKLSISNSELLDRATWVCGESGGSNELITNRVQNAGDASKTENATVAEYYAAAINNMSINTKGGFYSAIRIRMSRKGPNGTTIYTSDGYFKGEGNGGNVNSKAFVAARIKGGEALNADSRFYNSIGAVINSLNGSDPTGGCRAWLGGKYAAKYVSNPNVKYSNGKSSAKTQFSFSSKNGTFSHSFYRF